MDVRSAELTKYAANAMLATRISFMNELAQPRRAARRRHREGAPGHRLGPAHRLPLPLSGPGYGGSCFPKDVKALMRTARDVGLDARAAAGGRGASTSAQKQVLLRQDRRALRRRPARARRFALWGLAFKPNTDDMREAPSRVLIERAAGARAPTVRAYDPVAMEEAQRIYGDTPTTSRSCRHADGRAATAPTRSSIVTEWKEFRSPDFDALQGDAEGAGDLRRPQPLRPGGAARRGHRVLPDRQRRASEERRDHRRGAALLVVGDVMLDRYWFGDVARISPEAPVPVVRSSGARSAPAARPTSRATSRRSARRRSCCRSSATTRRAARSSGC